MPDLEGPGLQNEGHGANSPLQKAMRLIFRNGAGASFRPRKPSDNLKTSVKYGTVDHQGMRISPVATTPQPFISFCQTMTELLHLYAHY
jgi:hypothetical protein